MKKKIFFSVIALLIISAGTFYFVQNTQKEKNVGLAVTYNTVEELYNHSHLVLKGKVGDYKEIKVTRGNRLYTERLYNVEVKKVISNTSNEKVEKNDIIPLSVAVGFTELGHDTFYNVADQESYDIKNGNYLLFLNEFNDSELNQVVYVNNSPNNLYKENIKNGLLKSNGTTFDNVAGKGKEQITETEIENIKK